jgi:hypothetical protein
MRWAPGVTVFLLLLAVGAVAIGVVSHLPQSEVAPPPQPTAPSPPLPPPAVGSQWRYTTPRAAYASGPGVEACAKSEGDIEIGVAVGSAATLCLRRGGGYPYAGSIVLADTRGQFACLDCAVTARLDGGGAQSFNATAASTDGTHYALFIRDGAHLAGELKRASTATFTVPIHGAGEQHVTFNVAGLRWSG